LHVTQGPGKKAKKKAIATMGPGGWDGGYSTKTDCGNNDELGGRRKPSLKKRIQERDHLPSQKIKHRGTTENEKTMGKGGEFAGGTRNISMFRRKRH